MIQSDKYAIIRFSEKSPDGLIKKSLKKEIKNLREQGYKIINKIRY